MHKYRHWTACLLVMASGVATAQGSQGTGVYINPDGHVLTNRHVVAGGCSRLFVEDIAGNRAPASISRVSTTHDLALIRSERRTGPHAFFRVNEARDGAVPPALGESVHIVGFPEGEFGPRGGFIAELRDPKHGADGFTIGLGTTFGASGSPVFDDQGLLIGLVWGGADTGASIKAYAVTADAIFPLLSQVRVGTATLQQAPIKAKPQESRWEHIKNIVGTGATVTVKVFCL